MGIGLSDEEGHDTPRPVHALHEDLPDVGGLARPGVKSQGGREILGQLRQGLGEGVEHVGASEHHQMRRGQDLCATPVAGIEDEGARFGDGCPGHGHTQRGEVG